MNDFLERKRREQSQEFWRKRAKEQKDEYQRRKSEAEAKIIGNKVKSIEWGSEGRELTVWAFTFEDGTVVNLETDGFGAAPVISEII